MIARRLRSSSTPRRGIVTIAALVCLIVIAMICGALLRIGLTERGVVRAEEHRLQADWLVEAGLERAAARLSTDAGYTGETWALSPDDLGGPDPGEVTIAVETPKDHPDQRAVSVRAEYPKGSTRPVRQSKQMVFDQGKEKEKENEKADSGGSP